MSRTSEDSKSGFKWPRVLRNVSIGKRASSKDSRSVSYNPSPPPSYKTKASASTDNFSTTTSALDILASYTQLPPIIGTIDPNRPRKLSKSRNSTIFGSTLTSARSSVSALSQTPSQPLPFPSIPPTQPSSPTSSHFSKQSDKFTQTKPPVAGTPSCVSRGHYRTRTSSRTDATKIEEALRVVQGILDSHQYSTKLGAGGAGGVVKREKSGDDEALMILMQVETLKRVLGSPDSV